jgi:glutathione S-transferase
MIKVSAFRWVPPFAQGQVRDLRVRWALEEAGKPYEESLIGQKDQTSESYLRWQPFGQVPAYEENGLSMFESGAIVLHIAEQSQTLLPSDSIGRAHAITWMFAALNSMEPFAQNYGELEFFYPNEDWAKQRRPAAAAALKGRLAQLSARLGDREFLEGTFTAGDLLMSTVLRIVASTSLGIEEPNLVAYHRRCEARPAFRKALDAQLATFARHAPAA